MPVWAFGVEEHTDVVGRAGGPTGRLGLTCARGEESEISIDGAAGLRMRLGVRPADLVADLREVARALREDARPGLHFIDAFQPVDDELDRMLGCGEDEVRGGPHAVMPTAKLRDFEDARAFVIKFAGIAWRCEGPDLRYLLRRAEPAGRNAHRPVARRTDRDGRGPGAHGVPRRMQCAEVAGGHGVPG